MPDNRRFLLVRRPKGEPVPEDFSLVTEPAPALAEGQFLIRNHYASLDPAIRGWMDDAPSYMPPIPLGDPVRASTIGIVEASKADGFAPGQWVMGLNGIEDYSVGTVGGFTQPIDASLVPSVTNYLSVLGAVGMTAYFGYIDVCEPRPGDVVLVNTLLAQLFRPLDLLGMVYRTIRQGVTDMAAMFTLIDTGAEVTVMHRGIFGTRDPLAIRIGRMTVALRRSHALAIEVTAA